MELLREEVAGRPRSADKSARSVLAALHERLRRQGERPLSPSEFFPVPVEAIVSEVLGWHLERVETVGYRFTEDGTPVGKLHGESDKSTRVMKIGVRDASDGELRFTIAHEIGHVVLHGSAGVEHRVRSLRPVQRRAAMSPPSLQETREREADAFAAALLMPEKAVRARFRDQFRSPEIRFGSSQADQLTNIAARHGRRGMRRSNMSPLMQLASAAASNKTNTEGRSLCDYFGVSQGAMALRLCELRLVI